MPLNPGSLSITFTPPGAFVVDRLHTQPQSTASAFTQAGCTVQQLSVKDRIDNTAYTEATRKCMAPYSSNTAQDLSEWTATWAGADTDAVHRVLAFFPTYDQWGRIDHVTFLLKEEQG